MISYLFPTAIMFEIDVLEKTQPILGAIGTERHSEPNIQEQEPFKELADKVLKKSREYAEMMKWENELYLQSMWYNVMKQHEDHRPHTHGNSLLSGVYYPTGSPSHPPIEFFDNRNIGAINPTINDYTPENASTWHYPVVPNSLLIFPSWLQHWVPVNTIEIPRISISFNVMIKGQAGKEEDLNGVVWK